MQLKDFFQKKREILKLNRKNLSYKTNRYKYAPRLPIALANLKAGDTSQSLLNEIKQIMFFVSSKRNY